MPRRTAVSFALIAVATLAVFGRIVGHAWLGWDDLANTVRNPHLNPPTLEGTLYFWRHAYTDLYVPVTFTLWALLARIALAPWLFHAASLALHVAGAWAAFDLLRRLIRDERAACAGALLFALHPVQVETVAWMSGAKDLLCGLFALLALARYVAFAAAAPGARGRARDFGLASAYFVLALLSKPSGVAVPLCAAVIDLVLLARAPRRVARDLAPWVAIALVWIFVTRAVQPASAVASVALASRPFVALDALAFYAGKLAFPLHLAPDYGRDPAFVLGARLPYATALAALVLAAALVVAGGRSGRAAAGLFVAGVAPVLGLVPFDFQRYSTVADHYLYLSMIGPALAFAWAWSRATERGARIAAGAVLALLAARSALQVGVWRDDETLWRHTLLVNERSWTAHDNLGSALESSGRAAEAIPEFERALAINPRDARTHFNLGTALDELDRTAEAIPHLEEAVKLAPQDRLSRENLAVALLRAERPEDAEKQLRAALEIEPDSFLAHYYLAGALDRLGKTDEMIEHLREAVRLNPRFEAARRDLAGVLRARAQ
ncbi:MAG TPA: tetratricopeptide repeat protein [Planctomycetota bacterium]|jgi:tetratricopeptide (TPR) repeat protein|nr:tetratricopeptide repeat protein [Planctomycetota bacterium]